MAVLTILTSDGGAPEGMGDLIKGASAVFSGLGCGLGAGGGGDTSFQDAVNRNNVARMGAARE